MPDTPASPVPAEPAPAPPPQPASSGTLLATIALIMLPGIALILFMKQLEEHSIIGLSILAIFGIMILFGALALTATVFQRLSLNCNTEPLALPPGSIRATIALALIVLFALISVMLYRSLNQAYGVEHLTVDQKTALLQESANQVLAVIPEPCGKATCDAADMRYTVKLRLSSEPQSADLAKQLLIIVGTLMTSVTSFYFASRNNDAATKALSEALGTATNANAAPPPPPAPPPSPSPADGSTNGAPPPVTAAPDVAAAHSDSECGCDVEITNPTPDDQLPQARGGVAPASSQGAPT